MDPTTEAMGADALTAALTTAAFEVLTRASRRAKGRWKRRLKVARESIPYVAPVLVAGVRGGVAAMQDGDPLVAFLRGFLSGALAVWLRTAASAPWKIAEAGAPETHERGAP